MTVPDGLRDLFDAPLAGEHASARTERLRARAFLEDCVARGVFDPRSDSWLCGHSADFSEQLGAAGWIGMTWPASLGGRGLGTDVRYAVVEELLAAGAPVAAHWFSDRQ